MIKVLKLKIQTVAPLFLNKKEKGIAQMSKNLKTTGGEKASLFSTLAQNFRLSDLSNFHSIIDKIAKSNLQFVHS